MKNQRVVDAYDSMNPTEQQRQKMLQEIMKQAAQEDGNTPKPEEKIYTAMPSRSSWKTVIPALAACFIFMIAGGFLLTRMNDQPDTPAYIAPETTEGKGTVQTEAAENGYSDWNPTGSLYDPILQIYRTALEENWEYYQYTDAGISGDILTDSVRGKLGWCLMDVDGNGCEELIVSDGRYLYDMYTIPDGKQVYHIETANSDATKILCENGIIKRQLILDDRTYWTFYSLHNGFVLTPERTLVYRDDGYYEGSTEKDVKPISKDEAGQILSSFEPVSLALIPFQTTADDLHEEKNPNGVYVSLLQKYETALQEKWNMGQCSEAEISIMTANYVDNPEKIGYCLMDLDENDVQELLITDGNVILGLYTIVDETVQEIFLGYERTWYQLCEDSVIFCQGSGSAFTTYFTYYKLLGKELVVEKAYIFDAEADPENPWFFSDDGMTLGDPCGDFDPEADMDNGSVETIPFSPFA